MDKITIVGAGRVGESTAQFIAAKNMCQEIVLLDIREGAAEGAALDIQEVAPIFNYDTRLIGGTDHQLMSDSEIIIITAGLHANLACLVPMFYPATFQSWTALLKAP